MLYPSINLLRDKVDSKYTLVSLAAKRSRDLIDGKPALVDIDINKPVSIATAEIAEDLIGAGAEEDPVPVPLIRLRSFRLKPPRRLRLFRMKPRPRSMPLKARLQLVPLRVMPLKQR
jgi:DNA-directed RNA polymerase subunit omega